MQGTVAGSPAENKPKLLDQVRNVIRIKHYSIHRAGLRRLARKASGHALKIRRFFLMHYVYVLRSTSEGGLSIGYSANLRKRFQQHAQGDSFATSYRGPWKLIYYEAYTEQPDALGRERYLKSGGGRRFLQLQLAHYLKKNPIRGAPRE